MKKIYLMVLAFALTLSGFGQSLDMEPGGLVAPGSEIIVHFWTPQTYANDAWVGIIPSSVRHGSEAVNDQNDISYQYLSGRTEGIMTFRAPDQAGNYDFRMHNTDNNGQEVASITFEVGQVQETGDAYLELEQDIVPPGGRISVRFVAPSGLPNDAWVGIIPSHVEHGSESRNDQYDLTYQYLSGRTEGVLTFTAPSSPGEYDFRMHDTDNSGHEIASVSFVVR